jgi:LmbE family N-acetylglucosaminyl deacetylase
MWHKNTAQIFIPDRVPDQEALQRTTHIAVAAHQDDIEIMAVDGILACFQQADRWFTGVVMTNGAGSPRDSLYKDYTDVEMQLVRAKEQFKAAYIGEYSAQVLLDYTSAEVKDSLNKAPVEDLARLFEATGPEYVYTHNLADKHPTHVAVAMRTIQALRLLPDDLKPERVYGCEVWRSLEWMLDQDKVVFDTSSHENLQNSLVGVFDSQVAGGKRYDLATMGRRRANATYFASHNVDISTGMAFAMDLTPLVFDKDMDVIQYIQSFIDRFTGDVRKLIVSVE